MLYNKEQDGTKQATEQNKMQNILEHKTVHFFQNF